MDKDRQAQLGPLPNPPGGASTFSQNQPPGSMEKSKIRGQSDPQFNQAHAALLSSDDPSTDNGRLEAQPKRPLKANNSVLNATDVRNFDTNNDSGMLESQLGSRLNTMSETPQDTKNRSPSRRRNQPKSAFQNTLENFTSTWFVIPMNTGIFAIIKHQLPYQFNGLPVLSTIMYLVALTLFVIISSMTILRWTLYPKAAQPKTAASVDEMSFLATAPITFLTLISLTGLIVSNAYWGGHAWSLVAYTMWWIGMFWTLTTAVGVCVTLFRVELVDEHSMPLSPFLPAVGVATVALVGGQIVTYAYDISPRLAVPVIIVSYLLDGLAIWLSIILYGIFFQRLMACGWPEPAKRPTLMMLAGPFGQTSAALKALATAAMTKMDFADYHKWTFLQASAAPRVNIASVVFALLLLDHDLFWLLCGLFGVLEDIFSRQLGYNLTWWSTIFPVATITVAFLELSVSMDSPAFRVLTTALLLILLVDYFINWGFTMHLIFTTELLFKKADKGTPDEEKQD